MKEYILAIDPGNIETGYVFCELPSLKPVRFDKVKNYELLDIISDIFSGYNNAGCCVYCAIEKIAPYGMVVGREVFDTCIWIGRFTEKIYCVADDDNLISYIFRKDEKMYICHDSKAKDTNIRRALIDRFAKHDLKNGKGTKKAPDWFYGFKADVWAAYAVAVTWYEMRSEKAMSS